MCGQDRDQVHRWALIGVALSTFIGEARATAARSAFGELRRLAEDLTAAGTAGIRWAALKELEAFGGEPVRVESRRGDILAGGPRSSISSSASERAVSW